MSSLRVGLVDFSRDPQAGQRLLAGLLPLMADEALNLGLFVTGPIGRSVGQADLGIPYTQILPGTQAGDSQDPMRVFLEETAQQCSRLIIITGDRGDDLVKQQVAGSKALQQVQILVLGVPYRPEVQPANVTYYADAKSLMEALFT